MVRVVGWLSLGPGACGWAGSLVAGSWWLVVAGLSVL